MVIVVPIHGHGLYTFFHRLPVRSWRERLTWLSRVPPRSPRFLLWYAACYCPLPPRDEGGGNRADRPIWGRGFLDWAERGSGGIHRIVDTRE